MMNKIKYYLLRLLAVSVILFGANLSYAQYQGNDSKIKPEAIKQIELLIREKQSRTVTQRKIDSNLLYHIKIRRGEMSAEAVPALETNPEVDENGFVEVDIIAFVNDRLLEVLKSVGAEITVLLPEYRSITARVPVMSIETIAEMKEIVSIMPKQKGASSQSNRLPNGNKTNFDDYLNLNRSLSYEERMKRVNSFIKSKLYEKSQPEIGSVTSEGDVTHQANIFRSTFGFNGSGIKIGVLSDGINSLQASQNSGDLPPNVVSLPGQAGNGNEGTAMLEIVHDIAPGAQLYFATANSSMAQYAQNIRDLRNIANCDIIIDDWTYYVETPFQDGQTANVISDTNGGIVIQSVNEITQSGALFFSAAGNEGNKKSNTAGVWEGDYVDAGPATGVLSGVGNLHNFGNNNSLTTITAGRGRPIHLKWSDPLGGSNNDYDLYVLNSAGSAIVAFSDKVQNGSQDPSEMVAGSANTTGNKIVIVKFSGASRFLHLNTNGGRLDIATSGVIYGHSGGSNTISVASSPASNYRPPPNPVGPFPNVFNANNKVELSSSDGPRRIFYNAQGTAITPGNSSSTGGQLLQKPDLTAADGTATATPGFNPFFGTSAASPHAGAIAALIKSACPAATNNQVINALKATAIDIEITGIDQNSGVGIVMPIPAKNLLCNSVNNSKTKFDFDGDGKADISVFRPENGTWYLNQSSSGFTGAQFGISTDKIVPADYDGDGKTDLAVYRAGIWYLNRSQSGFTGFAFGDANDIPQPADFDGDGKAELAVFRPSNGTWYVFNLANNQFTAAQFGASTDKPVVGDYDNDGKADYAVYRAGVWYIQRSQLGFTGVQFGDSADKPVPADYDGDGKTDVAVFRPSNGTWYLLQSTAGFTGIQFGISTDLPTPADYDGDGKADIAVYRAGTWYLNRSSQGFTGVAFGAATDKPVQNAFVP